VSSRPSPGTRGVSGAAIPLAGSAPRVGVLGAASIPGARILEVVARAARSAGDSRPPVAIDKLRGRVATAQWRLADPATPAVVRALRDLDVAVWVAAETDLESALRVRPTERRERVVRTAQTLVTATAAAGVPRLIVVTSAQVYGAAADNPVPLSEDAHLNGIRDGGIVGDLLAVEDVIEDARRVHPGLSITVVRPAALVGPGIDTVVTRHFEAPRLLTVKGANPAWQFCHLDDLAAAVGVVTCSELGSVLTVGAPGWLSQEQVEALTGMRRIQLSEATALGTAARLHRFGVLPAPASELAHALYPWVIDSARLRAGGWAAAYDNETCVGVMLESIKGRHAVVARRVDRKDAALGAASAAVALVGTAAVLRRARRS
jgi:nucleoside-diphosphate-sugar epimerase